MSLFPAYTRYVFSRANASFYLQYCYLRDKSFRHVVAALVLSVRLGIKGLISVTCMHYCVLVYLMSHYCVFLPWHYCCVPHYCGCTLYVETSSYVVAQLSSVLKCSSQVI